jgi:FtsZ-interacting cell division protein ZipA
METGLRFFLLLLGAVILAGIIWDFKKNRGQSKFSFKKKTFISKETPSMDFAQEALLDEVGSNLSELIVLQVMAKHPEQWSGRKLIDVFNQSYLYYGEMQIFHRHENMDGTGPVIFSLASAVEPGFFEADSMADYTTPGLTLFFNTTHPNQSVAAFELMLRTAKQLAQRLDGEVRDDKRKPLTITLIETYRERVREKRVA